jgi:hypothetical protein
VFEEFPQPELVQRVVREGYANDLIDDEIEKLGRDPFLVAYGLVDADRCIATTEVLRPAKQRHNRHIPDVCTRLKLSCCGPWDLNKHLGFKTGWKP